MRVRVPLTVAVTANRGLTRKAACGVAASALRAIISHAQDGAWLAAPGQGVSLIRARGISGLEQQMPNMTGRGGSCSQLQRV